MYSQINEEENLKINVKCLTISVKYLIYIQILILIANVFSITIFCIIVKDLANNKDIQSLMNLFGAVKVSDINYLISRIKKEDFLEFFEIVETCIQNKCDTGFKILN